jgi:hypothetical protein
MCVMKSVIRSFVPVPLPSRDRICKHNRSPGNDSEESIPPGWESIPGILKRSEAETTFHYYWRVKSGLNFIYLTVKLTDWLLVEVALLLIGLTKTGCDDPSVMESPLVLGCCLRSYI